MGRTLNDRPVVTVQDLYYAYPPLAPGDSPTEALRGVTFSVARGEFIVVMGHSGAGKTTLCLALCAIVPHSTGGVFGGSAIVTGQDTRHTKPAELSAYVGTVFQDPESQLFAATVEDEVAFGLESQGLPRAEIVERVSWALEQVRLSDHRLRNPAYLSGGQKQRVAIAAAIATHPQLLVLDEPTASLDPVGSQEVAQVLADLRRKLDSAIVMVTQDAELAADFADRIILMRNGQIGRDEPADVILARPELLHEYAVQPPVLSELAQWLRQQGLPLHFHSLAEAEQALSASLSQRSACPLS
ncbi:MAG: energy-coupling factor ABC transporter ATP-binding protein [Anaerolineae bacterium]